MSKFAFTEDETLVPYVPKKNKAVILLSTMHHDKTIDADTAHKMKPEIITFYNKTKGGVDSVDQMCYNCSVYRRSKWWPMVLIASCLNISVINSFILWKLATKKDATRSEFNKILSRKLIQQQIDKRVSLSQPHDLKIILKKYSSPSPAKKT